jgi:hypothetical protein
MNSILFKGFGCLHKRQPFFFLLFLILLLGCKGKNSETHRDFKVLFNVNGVERTVFDFESKYVKHLIKTGRNDTKNERYAFLNELIDIILLAEAGADHGLLNHQIYKSAITYQERKSMLDYYFSDEMGELLEPPTDEETRLAYAKRQRKVFVRQLYSQNVEDLTESYQRLMTGDNFIDVANDFYKTETYDSLAGYIGPISYFGVDDAFAEAAYSTNLNEFSKPIRTQLGYHIIYIEHIEFPAMLTEDDYQYRKKGVTSQLRLRKQQLVSNEYVQTLMNGLSVEADAENIMKLREIILNLEGNTIINADENPENIEEGNWTDERIQLLERSFDNEATLASYKQNGVIIEFTFGDYIKWLPYLSFQESKVRTGASVGRGLRNEIIYQLASNENYIQDERVVKDVNVRGYEILSDLYQYDLIKTALLDTSSIEVPNSYKDRLIKNRNVVIKSEYWKITTNGLEEAERIKEEINSGDLPISYDAFQKYDYQTISSSDNDFNLIRKALVNTPVIGYSETDGWMVLNVVQRDLTEVKDETSTADIETKYRVFTTINSEIESLRKEATIKVDTLLFNDIYEVWKIRKEEE